MCSARDNVALPTLGFPIRVSAGHWLFSASPRLIAAVHALHRLQVPRHPPCALPILTVFRRDILTGCRVEGGLRDHSVILVRTALCEAALRWHECAVFKVREEKTRVQVLDGRSLKTQQHEPAIEAGPRSGRH